jgi:hypothetical protein
MVVDDSDATLLERGRIVGFVTFGCTGKVSTLFIHQPVKTLPMWRVFAVIPI